MRTLLVAALMLVVSACSGLSARQEALLPAMRLAWQGVQLDVSRGIEESLTAARIEPTAAEAQRVAVADLTSALATGSPPGIAGVAWTPLKDSAEFGLQQRIARNEISTGVAGSLRERLKNFGDSLTKYLERR